MLHLLADENFPGDAVMALPATSGVVLFRISAPSAEVIARVATAVLSQRTDWAGHFSVVDDQRIRMTPLPER